MDALHANPHSGAREEARVQRPDDRQRLLLLPPALPVRHVVGSFAFSLSRLFHQRTFEGFSSFLFLPLLGDGPFFFRSLIFRHPCFTITGSKAKQREERVCARERKADSSRARVQSLLINLAHSIHSVSLTWLCVLRKEERDPLILFLPSVSSLAAREQKKDFLQIIFNFNSRRQENHLQIGL